MCDQHDDHIWLRANGEGWAIRKIERHPPFITFHLWRGYSPDLEYQVLTQRERDWTRYCDCAAEMLKTYWR